MELFLQKPYELQLREAGPAPSPTGDEVKIKVIYGGICGSDLGVFQGKLRHAIYPLRPGHELVGRVIKAGSAASIPVGTRVVVLPNTFCGKCSYCRRGKTNICENKQSLGVNADGGFAQEFLISSRYVLPIPDDLSDQKAVLIEPFAVVVHALQKVRLGKDCTVCVVGCGNEGMLAAALASHLGAKVTAIDINPRKLDLVSKLGEGIQAVLPQAVQQATFDVVIEAGGTKGAVEQGIQLVRPGGEMVVIGLAQEAILPVAHMVRNELTLFGTIIYNFPDDYLRAIDYLLDPSFRADAIISLTLPITAYRQAFESALTGDHGKIILDFKGV
nr:alcohol dehydrogenase catalytic domain-containing protein [Brevibacillus fulvus]